MALNINGTTGISGVDGSASAPAVTGTDSNTGINFASDTVNINTGGSTRATVDSAGRLLLGTTTEGEGGADDLTISNTSADMGITLRSGTSNNGQIFFSDGTSGNAEFAGFIQYAHNGNSMRFGVNESERMRVSSVGRILINNTSEDFARVCLSVNASSEQPFSINDSNNTSTLTSRIGFRTGGTQVGIIKSSNSATQYNTSSDYRLKENAVSISDGITRIKTLKPYKFNWIIDETNTPVDGFFAHEVSGVVPEAISGTKDKVADAADVARGDANEVGDPVHQQIDQSKLVPLLTAALQEAIAKIEVLETKVATLEAA